MKVFISWSGDRSKAIATFLREWIPDVMQAADPWVSSEDIAAGARWNNQIQRKLEESKFGIICLTTDNLRSSWIHFETGALAKTLEDSFVCPYLIGMEPEDVPEGPLTQFQGNRASKDGTWKIILSMNEAMKDASLPKEQLERQFVRCWPELEKTLDALPPAAAEGAEPRRTPEVMIAEILEIVRGLSRWTSTRDVIESMKVLHSGTGLLSTPPLYSLQKSTIEAGKLFLSQYPSLQAPGWSDPELLKQAIVALEQKQKAERTEAKETESAGGEDKE